jgi:beta-lactamase regulating signal transducer with metallopeptidase domain
MTFLLQASFFGGLLVLALLTLRRTRWGSGIAAGCALAAWVRFLLPLPIWSPLSLHRLWLALSASASVTTRITRPFSGDPVVSVTVSPHLPVPLWPALFLLWAAGALAAALALARLLFRQRRMLRVCIPLEEGSPAARTVRDAAAGMRRNIRVYRCETVLAPVTDGILRPRIVIPCAAGDEKALQLALAHEIEHIRAWHGLIKLLMLLACCLHWFNPLCWRLKTLLSEELELACDRRALTRLGEKARGAYAQALLYFYGRGVRPAFGSSFGGGAAEERIRRILLYRPARRRTAWLSGGLALLMFGTLAALPTPAVVSVSFRSSDWTDGGAASSSYSPVYESLTVVTAAEDSLLGERADTYTAYLVEEEADRAQSGARRSFLLQLLPVLGGTGSASEDILAGSGDSIAMEAER